MFYFGIYSIDKSYTPTWQREDDQRDGGDNHDKDSEVEVKSAYSDMIGEEAKKAETNKKKETFITYV